MSIKSYIFDSAKTILLTLLMFMMISYASGTRHFASVVISGSMEPVFHRGDMIFSSGISDDIQMEDIVIFQTNDKDKYIVHRIIDVSFSDNGEPEFLTKGDNNSVDDYIGGIYPSPQFRLDRSNIFAKVHFSIPYLGYPTILIKENLFLTIPIFVFLIARDLIEERKLNQKKKRK